MPASAAVLAPASAGCLGLNSRLSRPLAGSYAFLGRLPRPCPSVLLLRHRPRHHRQRRHWLRSVCRPHHGAYNADVGLINRSRACPQARAYHRSSIGLPRHRPFGLQRHRLWSILPAFDAPCTLLVASRRCSDLRLAATLVPRVVTLPHAVYFAVLHTDVPCHPCAVSLGAGRHRPHMVFFTFLGSSLPTSSTAAALLVAGLAD